MLPDVSREGISATDFATKEFATLDTDGNPLTFFRWNDRLDLAAIGQPRADRTHLQRVCRHRFEANRAVSMAIHPGSEQCHGTSLVIPVPKRK